MKKLFVFISSLFCFLIPGFSQETSPKAFNQKYMNWYNLDLKDDNVAGASVDKAYKELLNDKKPKKTVIVAVLDGGVDINCEDLKGKIWINEDEIPMNNIDDDHNGYVDDVYGWNFLGKGDKNLYYENTEYTRILKSGPGNQEYQAAKAAYDKELAKKENEKTNIGRFEEKYNSCRKLIKDETGVDVHSLADLDRVSSTNQKVLEAYSFLKSRYDAGFNENILSQIKKRNSTSLEKYLNTDFNPRLIIGDNPEDIDDNHYGNPDVIGPFASHGTCCAGIIAGCRNNGIGINGIAGDVKIMVLRIVPDGDERDKDIALAIRYAVDNGADILNMSFGKNFSPQRKFVDEAIKYAEQKNVLLVHAAGNQAENSDNVAHYPSDIYMNNTEASNFINVGASRQTLNDSLACIFSNYGRKHVDLFAPGESIISLDTTNLYSLHSGTSQAAPVVTGVAAVLLSYYPELKPADLIALLMETSTVLKKNKVLIPDLEDEKRNTVKFGKLSKSGGIVNLYNALDKLMTE